MSFSLTSCADSSLRLVSLTDVSQYLYAQKSPKSEFKRTKVNETQILAESAEDLTTVSFEKSDTFASSYESPVMYVGINTEISMTAIRANMYAWYLTNLI